jgi:hypothetical protein
VGPDGSGQFDRIILPDPADPDQGVNFKQMKKLKNHTFFLKISKKLPKILKIMKPLTLIRKIKHCKLAML